jgi:hypothetical protein
LLLPQPQPQPQAVALLLEPSPAYLLHSQQQTLLPLRVAPGLSLKKGMLLLLLLLQAL